jgi:hypothetical protein
MKTYHTQIEVWLMSYMKTYRTQIVIGSCSFATTSFMQCFPFAILVETHLVKVIDLQEEIQRQICHVDQNNPLMARNK